MTSTTQQNGDTGVAREVKQTPLANHKDALRNKPRKAARPKPPDVLKAISEATGPPSLVAASEPVASPALPPLPPNLAHYPQLLCRRQLRRFASFRFKRKSPVANTAEPRGSQRKARSKA